MSKVGGALPSWYWPAGISRRVPVSQQPLGRTLNQRFKTSADKVAIISDGRSTTFSELSAQVTAVAGGLQSLSTTGTITIVDPDPAEALVQLLGGLLSGRAVYLPRDIRSDLPAQMGKAKSDLLLTSKVAALSYEGFTTLRISDLVGKFNEASVPRRARDPCVYLDGDRGIVTHSHFSLSAMAASMAAFIPELRKNGYLCLAPSLGSWEELTGILLALTSGMPVIFSSLEQQPPSIPLYLVLRRPQVDLILTERRAPDIVREASHVFVSTGPFSRSWRQQLELRCGAPVYPIWGVPELGPVLAAHPTWLPPHGHGFPLVNVSLIPIDPGTGNVSIVPWEMLERAEMGVETLSAMIGYVEPSRNATAKAGTALRTGQIASMDHVGVVALLEEAKRHDARA